MLSASISKRLSAAVLVCATLSACEQNSAPASPGQQHGTAIKTVTASSSNIASPLEALGTLKALQATSITSSVSEKLTELHFQDGQQVKKGALIATLEQGEEQAQLLAAKAELAEHQREIARLSRLLKTQAAARTEYDQRLSLRDQAQAKIAEVQAKIDERTLRAPFSGHLGLRQVSTGALLSPGTAITTLDQLDILQLDFQIPSRAMSAIRVGQTIEAHSTALNKSVNATITAINPRVDAVSRSLTARALVKNPERHFKPGMLMQIRIRPLSEPAITLPEHSLLIDQDRSYVWVVDEQQRAQQRTVEVGHRVNGLVEIRQGLEVGEQVITEGFMMLRPGAPVSPQTDRSES